MYEEMNLLVFAGMSLLLIPWAATGPIMNRLCFQGCGNFFDDIADLTKICFPWATEDEVCWIKSPM